MHRSTLGLILLLLAMAGLVGYNYFFIIPARQSANLQVEQLEPSPSPSPTIPPSQQLVEQMSAKEKISQLLAVPVLVNEGAAATNSSLVASQVESASISAATDTVQQTTVTPTWASEYRPGFVVLFGTNVSFDTAAKVVNSFKSIVLPVKIAVAVDHEGGAVQRLNGEGLTKLASWQELCQMSVPNRRSLLSKAATELAELKIDLVLGPVVDLASNNKVLGNRICAAEPLTVVARAIEAIEIYQQAGVAAVIKHFPGIGSANVDLHKQFTSVDVGEAEAEVYRQILDRYPQTGVMVGHVGVNNQFADVPCVYSKSCVGQLRTAYPEALRVTDDLLMKAAARNGVDKFDLSLSQRAFAAIMAGNDVLLFAQGATAINLSDMILQLEAFYQQDKIFAQAVDEAVVRVVEWKLQN